MKITVDKKTCIGCGLCGELYPDLFELKKNTTIPKKTEDLVSREIEEVNEAILSCPVRAINLE